jgi:hypothetical protein
VLHSGNFIVLIDHVNVLLCTHFFHGYQKLLQLSYLLTLLID